MNDALRTKLNLTLTAIVAFAVGIGIAARLDLTPPGLARLADNPPLTLRVVEPQPVQNDALPQAGFSDIAERVTPAVVTIFVERTIDAHTREGNLPPAFEDFFQQRPPQVVRGSGSGFIVSEDGYVVTNNHVVDGADKINIQLSDRREFTADLVGRDPTTDVALLKLHADHLTPVTLGSSDATRVGEWVLAIGSPGFRGVGGPLTTTVTAGIVSAKGRSINIIGQELASRNEDNLAIEDFIQTDAAINPGNSGGPLLNIRGEVIGVNAAIASSTGSNEGYGFAVPIDLVQEVIDDLVKYGEVRRALLGVNITGVDDTEARYYGLDEVAGAKVWGVNQGMAAQKAGIEVGDVIVAVDGEKVGSVPDLQRKIRSHEPGESVDVTVVRRADLKRETLKVKLMDAGEMSREEAPRVVSAESSDPLGIEVEGLTGEARRALDLPRNLEGVVIVSYDEYGPVARRAGPNLRGMVITAINRKPIHNLAEYREAVKKLEPGEVVGLDVYNPQDAVEVPLTIAIPE
ncbi:MAG: Do family serine endopeptidase [Candidatus Palauibacterales bacterium]|nr:Do family serine endopeptidase [Candidatus Palauibacterales bacterium]